MAYNHWMKRIERTGRYFRRRRDKHGRRRFTRDDFSLGGVGRARPERTPRARLFWLATPGLFLLIVLAPHLIAGRIGLLATMGMVIGLLFALHAWTSSAPLRVRITATAVCLLYPVLFFFTL